MLEKVREIFKNKDERVGMCWVEETLPVYHDSAFTTNKRVYVVKKCVEPNIYEAFELRNLLDTTLSPFLSKKAVTQDGLPLKFDRKEKVLNNNIQFTKDGYSQGVCVYIEGLGYLGNIKDTLKVWVVSDKYVFFKTISKNPTIFVYSFEELKRMNIEFI